MRSERAFCDELEYNLLFRWFLDMDPIEPSFDFDPTVCTKNRERLLKHEVGQQLFDEVVGQANARGLLSDERFTVSATTDPARSATRTSVTRRTDAGLSKPEIIRCLKRYLAQEIYRILVRPPTSLLSPADSDVAQPSALVS